MTFTNDSKADLTFNLSLNGPFEIVKTKTNSGAVHPLSGTDTKAKAGSKVLKPKVETMFCLQPLKIVEVHVKFLAPPASDKAEWPMTIRNERNGELIAYFANGDQQKLFLDGVLMRPKVQILTDFLSKNDYAMDELDFGRVNVEKSRRIHIYLSNDTDVTARWQLNYVTFPKKQTIGHNTTTPWEVENMEKTDDASVFEFSVFTVSIVFHFSFNLFISILGYTQRHIPSTAQSPRRPVSPTSAQGRRGEEIPAADDFRRFQAKEKRAVQEQVQVHMRNGNSMRYHP